MTWKPELHPRIPGGPGGGEFRSPQAGWMRRLSEGISEDQGTHDYIRGRDLRDKLPMEHLQSLAYRPGTGQHPDDDPQLAGIYALQGFDGKPEVLSKAEMDARVAAGWTPLWRGVEGRRSDSSRHATDHLPTSGELADQFRDGPYWAGQGVRGNGTYLTPHLSVAQDYSVREGEWYGPQDGAYYNPGPEWPGVLRLALRPDARTIEWDEIDRITGAYVNQKGRKRPAFDPLSDEGRMAAAMGYDAIIARGAGKNSDKIRMVVLLNRTAVAVQEADR